LRRLSHDELCVYVKSVISHSHDLVEVLKAQRLQIGLDEMVIKWLQWQVYQKEQHGNRQGSLTTMATIATELDFIKIVKERENAANAKKARREALQKASARRKTLRELRAAVIDDERDNGSFDLGQIQVELRELGVNLALASKPTEQQMTHSGAMKSLSGSRPISSRACQHYVEILVRS
jgi:hypothetical protein